MIDLQHVIHRVRHSNPTRVEGRVEKVVGLLVEVAGLAPPIGTELEVRVRDRALLLEVVGFRDGRALAAPLGPIAGIEPGAWVSTRAEAGEVEVFEALLGRVLDAFGRPLDGVPAPKCVHRVPLHAAPPPPFARRPIDVALETGVRALDALLPLGMGQRMGLFAGTGVGKSTLLGMLCRHTKADVIVVGLVGERGREVLDFVRGALGEEGSRAPWWSPRPATQPPLVRVRGALRATAIAEYFRDRGHSVLLVMDSVTRYAMALREAARSPPASRR